ncbi:enhanced serine sensitivity protein SseB C-terminal domain-containing protein [Moellerella wisconsensis]|uniref:SseB family protein n=2 Tax=Moellerella wisconsensis TaxID=158849 RepID=A0A0N0IAL3_9GAMM|nr:enhanced serine sensitivity protein SseB C-terminal domain-containing protein [Moellerella wisconsensis]KLN96800.1 Enhances serine sensitivity [Moellerella wisconsensis]KPD03030.1 SseB family protein [Moellerella wisconsensis ATCC 35017]UNH26349.1 enhanced serine sensitivity protein SseB C-terminal domain-containing protein [Moellerella wisconsensis]UNH29763.1 enhanced serine sensitivity protein SseB C-terminal domain-containing protein [Moellerella wisconsensis]UNH41457.1 enhanced serine s
MSHPQEPKPELVTPNDDIQVAKITVPSGSAIKLSAVENQPPALVNTLSELFKQHKLIRRAFLVLAQEEKSEDPAVMLIGLEMTGDWDEDTLDNIIHQAGTLACEHLEDGESIDFCLVNEDEAGISHFMTQHIAPFYQRRLGGFIRDAIPIKNT